MFPATPKQVKQVLFYTLFYLPQQPAAVMERLTFAFLRCPTF
jgi:hypothetical protein